MAAAQSHCGAYELARLFWYGDIAIMAQGLY